MTDDDIIDELAGMRTRDDREVACHEAAVRMTELLAERNAARAARDEAVAQREAARDEAFNALGALDDLKKRAEKAEADLSQIAAYADYDAAGGAVDDESATLTRVGVGTLFIRRIKERITATTRAEKAERELAAARARMEECSNETAQEAVARADIAESRAQKAEAEVAELRAGPGGRYLAALEQDDPAAWMNEQLLAVESERDKATRELNLLVSTLARLFDWEDKTPLRAIMHVENAVLSLRTDTAVAYADGRAAGLKKAADILTWHRREVWESEADADAKLDVLDEAARRVLADGEEPLSRGHRKLLLWLGTNGPLTRPSEDWRFSGFVWLVARDLVDVHTDEAAGTTTVTINKAGRRTLGRPEEYGDYRDFTKDGETRAAVYATIALAKMLREIMVAGHLHDADVTFEEALGGGSDLVRIVNAHSAALDGLAELAGGFGSP